MTKDEETAVHEAGHVVAGYLLQRYPLWVSIIPDGRGGVGRTEFEEDAPKGGYRYFDDGDRKKQYIHTRVIIEVAGTVAHDIKCPGRTHDQGDAHDDRWAKELVAESVSWEDKDDYLTRAKQDARALLRRNWSIVEKVAAALVERQKMERAELLKILGMSSPTSHSE